MVGEDQQTLDTDPAKNAKGEFMQEDEIAFIVEKDIETINTVTIIGKNAYDILKPKAVTKEQPFTHYIFKMDNEYDCSKIGAFEINAIPETNKIYINSIDTKKINHVVFQFDDTTKIRFNKNDTSAIDCNTTVMIKNGAYYAIGSDEAIIISGPPTTITAKKGELIFDPELPTGEGGKPRRKRNKASMKKYKKRKSSTGKKKKIPRRRSRKLRRMK